MLPTSRTPRSAAPEVKPGKIPVIQPHGSEPHALQAAGPDAALAPIGSKRLRALREAIRNGTYPTDDDVLGGLERMFEGSTGGAT